MPILKEATEGINFYQKHGGWAISATLLLLAYLFYKKVALPIINFLKAERKAIAAKFETMAQDRKDDNDAALALVGANTEALNNNNKYLRDIVKTLEVCDIKLKECANDDTVFIDK